MARIVFSVLAAVAIGLFAGTSAARAGGSHNHHAHHHVHRPIVVYPTVYPYYYHRPYTFNPYSLYPQVLTPPPVFFYRGY